MRKREERMECTTLPSRAGLSLVRSPSLSLSPLRLYPSFILAASPVFPSPGCRSPSALSLCNAYGLSDFIISVLISKYVPELSLNFVTFCFIHFFTLTRVSVSDAPLNRVIGPALVISSLGTRNSKVQSLVIFSSREKRNKTLGVHCWQWRQAVSSQKVREMSKKSNTQCVESATHTLAETTKFVCLSCIVCLFL